MKIKVIFTSLAALLLLVTVSNGYGKSKEPKSSVYSRKVSAIKALKKSGI